MDAAATVARLHRRAGFGLAPGERAAAVQRGLDAEVARLLDPDGAGIPVPDDAWTGVDLSFTQGQVTVTAVEMVHGWIGRMVATPRPLEERMAWFWHGQFVSALSKVRLPLAMATQIRLFQRAGLGSFPALVKAVTVDPAMLLYLDGTTSTGAAPNENYGREVLELFTLGRGNYAEADVHAGAVVLTGWHVDRADPSRSVFAPRRHDDFAPDVPRPARRARRRLGRRRHHGPAGVRVVRRRQDRPGVGENGSGGTDHGQAGVQFLVGPMVKGGLYGEPNLGALDDGDVAAQIDTGSLYTAALDWLGGPADEVLGGKFDALGVIA